MIEDARSLLISTLLVSGLIFVIQAPRTTMCGSIEKDPPDQSDVNIYSIFLIENWPAWPAFGNKLFSMRAFFARVQSRPFDRLDFPSWSTFRQGSKG